MTMTLTLNRNYLLLIPLLLVASLYYVGMSIDLIDIEYLGPAVLIDLFITSPIVYYLVIRKNKNIPNTTVIPFMLVNLAVANWIFPVSMKSNLDIITYYVFPILELGIISFIVWKVRQSIILFKRNKTGQTDFYDILKQTTQSIMPSKRLSAVLASEIAMLYYALFSWRKQNDTNAFTHYQDNGLMALLWVIVLIIAAETIPVHLLVSGWSPVVAWILTISSIYFFLQILGHIKALRTRKTEIHGGQLVLRNGIYGDVTIPFDNIQLVDQTSNKPKVEDKDVLYLGMLGELESHNLAIHLKTSQTMNLPYGMHKTFDILLLQIDQKEAFINKIEKNI